MTNYKVFDSPTRSRQFSVSRWLSSVVFGAIVGGALSASASGTLSAIAALAILMPVEAAECPLPHRSGDLEESR